MYRILVPAAVSALLFVGCAAEVAGDGPSPDTPPTTSPVVPSPPTTITPTPTTGAPTTTPTTTAAPTPTTVAPAPPSTTVAPTPTDPPDPTLPPELVDVDLVVDDGSYDSVASMVADATTIVVGDVVAVDSLGRIGGGTDEFVALRIDVDDTLLGEPVAGLVLAWNAFRTGADGTRIGRHVTNGIPVPGSGDRLLLFLDPVDPSFAELLGGEPTHQLVKLDGLLTLVDGRIVSGEAGSPVVASLVGRSVDDVAAELDVG